jgi:hypothetical protein
MLLLMIASLEFNERSDDDGDKRFIASRSVTVY